MTGRLSPDSSDDQTFHWPPVSVIVAARDAGRTLSPCLTTLAALDYPEVEIIVVDDGSTDDTADIARAHGVRLLSSEGRGPSAARNLGTTHASHEIVAFTDADCLVPAHWLHVLVAGLRDRRAAGVGSGQRNVFPPDADGDARDLDAFFALASYLAEYTRVDRHDHAVDHNASCNVAYVKHVLIDVGGFTEGLWPGEDVDLDYRIRRLGYRLWHVHGAEVQHVRPGTREWFANMMRRYGRAQRALVVRHGRFRPLHYVPAGLAGIAALHVLLAPRRTRGAILALDAVLAVGAVAALSARVPIDQWLAVARYTAIAVREWTIGYAEGDA